jgi:hypothetical protein
LITVSAWFGKAGRMYRPLQSFATAWKIIASASAL